MGFWEDFGNNINNILNWKGPQGNPDTRQNKPAPLIDGNKLGDWSGLGGLEYQGPNEKNWLGTINYRPPAGRQEQKPAETMPFQPTFRGPRPTNPNGGSGFSMQELAGLDTDMSADRTDALSVEEQRMQDAIAALEVLVGQQYKDDGSYNAIIDEAFGGSLKAIDDAEAKAQGNYKQSDAYLGELTNGHVNAIKTEDRSQLQATGDNLVKGIGQTYDNATSAVQADRQREINDRMEAMKRLGLEASGMQDVGAERTGTINNLTTGKAEAVAQAQGNTTTDLQLNTARATAQAGEGVARRGELRQDLDRILGDLSNSRAGVQNSMAQARLQAQQADRAAFDSSKRENMDALDRYYDNAREDKIMNREDERAERELQAKLAGKQAGSGSALDVANQRLSAKGVDANAILDAYSNVLAENRYNSNSGQDMNSFIISEMAKKSNGRFTATDINEWLSIVSNYGTDKATAVL